MKPGDVVRIAHRNREFDQKTAVVLELMGEGEHAEVLLKLSGRSAQTLRLPRSAVKEQ